MPRNTTDRTREAGARGKRGQFGHQRSPGGAGALEHGERELDRQGVARSDTDNVLGKTQIPSYALRRTVSRFLTPVRGLRQRIQWCFLKARDSTASSSES